MDEEGDLAVVDRVANVLEDIQQLHSQDIAFSFQSFTGNGGRDRLVLVLVLVGGIKR